MKQPITIILKHNELEPTKQACELLNIEFKVGEPFTGWSGDSYTRFTVHATPEDVFAIGRASRVYQDLNETNYKL